MKVLVPPAECEVSFSIGTFFENYDVTKRKLLDVETYSTVQKRTKREEKHLMETTQFLPSIRAPYHSMSDLCILSFFLIFDESFLNTSCTIMRYFIFVHYIQSLEQFKPHNTPLFWYVFSCMKLGFWTSRNARTQGHEVTLHSLGKFNRVCWKKFVLQPVPLIKTQLSWC